MYSYFYLKIRFHIRNRFFATVCSPESCSLNFVRSVNTVAPNRNYAELSLRNCTTSWLIISQRIWWFFNGVYKCWRFSECWRLRRQIYWKLFEACQIVHVNSLYYLMIYVNNGSHLKDNWPWKVYVGKTPLTNWRWVNKNGVE